MGLPRLLGFGPDQQADIAELAAVGEPATPDELEEVWGVRELPASEVTADAIVAFNNPDFRAGAMPGGGGIARAADIARFYQELLHNRSGVFDDELLVDVTSNVRTDLPDPFGVPAVRTLGLVVAGDDGRSHLRGMGRTVSPGAFGHNGAGGQLVWADPATGLSFCYLTNGYDIHEIRQRRRGTALGSLAAVCAAPIAAD
jgi:CubicO group peptidase (beta-lactamase class C family)